MEERRLGGNKLQLLSQALSAAISSLNLAKQLIGEIEHSGSFETPGLVGKFDGRFMVTAAGKKYPVPDNYAAKTKLVYGDKLKMIETREGRRFKYVGRLPYVEVEATLTQKDGQFVAVNPEGSYRVLQSAIKYYQGAEGDKVRILLPRDEKHAPFAAVGGIAGKEPKGRREGRGREDRPKADGPQAQKKPVEEKKAEPAEKKVAEPKKASPAEVSPKADEGGRREEPKKEPEKPKEAVKEEPKKEEKPAKRETKKASGAKSAVASGEGRKKTAAKKAAKAAPAKSKKTAAAKKSTKAAPAKKSPPAGRQGEISIEPPGEDELV
jgi:hypothetical protein